jgi:serine/threonine-protein kinase
MFPQIFGKYVLEREIAAGGMARVFLATLRGAGGFEKRLVVKQIRPELASDQSFIGRFVAEAKTTVELSHSNIVPVYELGAEQGTYYIAMEFCAGVSLNQLLSAGALSPAEGAYIGVEICRALDYAHRKAGIVHRDVTPRNVMIDPEGMVRLIDFGIAASADSDATGRGPLFGSPGHMPPEQLRRGPLTPAADVFAVGVLLIETWTGKAPFRRASFEASAEAFEQAPPDIAESDARLAPLSALLAAAVALEAHQRPQSAEELARPLREFLRQSDLGDIARRLGQRVSQVLACPSEPVHSAGEPHRSSPVTASGATQTFAVRDAILEWTAKIDSQPPRAALAAVAGGAGRVLTTYRVAGAVAVSLVVVLGSLHLMGRAMGSWEGADSSQQRSLTERAAPHALAAHSPAGASEPEPVVAPPIAPVVPVLPAHGSTFEGPGVTRTGAAASAKAAVSSPPASGAPSRVTSGVALPNARVHLTAEPPALVEVDAATVGRTPLLSFPLAPGRHEIVFVNEMLGEKLRTRLTLASAELQRVHADFTSATPQVYVR